jgi:4-carboxymuconolactone decarboxylase
MAQAPLDDATLCLVDLAAAVATGNDKYLRESAERAVALQVPAEWVDELVLQSVLMVGWPRALMAMGVWRSIAGHDAPAQDPDIDYDAAAGWYSRGQETCRIVYGENYEKLRANVRRLHPALDAWMIIEGYGRTLSRPGLDLIRRELCTVVQTAVLDTPHQLHSHLRGALNAGATTAQVGAALDAVKSLMTQEQSVKAENLWQDVRERATHHAD